MEKIRNFTHKLFYDNKALVAVSFAISVVIWFVVMMFFSPIDTVVIESVPVNINLTDSTPAQLGLETFGLNEFTVDIEVEGKRYLINSGAVNADSFNVTAMTAYVDSAGKHTLEIKVTKKNENDEFKIVNVSKDYIEVFFDVRIEREFPIEPKVIQSGKAVKDGYVLGAPFASRRTVKVSGPNTEVSAIKNIWAEASFDSELTKTTTEKAVINACNESGGILHYIDFGDIEVSVTQPVYPEAEKPVKVDFINTPAAYFEEGIDYTITPNKVKGGILNTDDPSQIKELSIKTIDFSELKPGVNTFVIKAEDVSSVMVTDDTEEFVVTVNVKDFAERTFAFDDDNIEFTNIPKDFTVERVKKSVGPVTVYGPIDSLEKLQSSDIYAMVDLKKADLNTDEQIVTATITIKNNSDCWAYGKYTVTIISK